MTAISELRKKALEENPGYPIEFDDGKSIRLRPNLELSDEELDAFQVKVTAIQDMEDAEGLTVKDVRSAIVDALASVADDPELASRELGSESIALLNVIMAEYAKSVGSDSKSEGPNRATRRGRGTSNR
jgi:hypothetical protein